MSQQLIDRSADLKKLRDEGFDIEIRSGFLLVKEVPYVTSNRQVKRGMIVTPLTLAGDTTTTPSDHVVDFVGEPPCDNGGLVLRRIIIESTNRQLAADLTINHKFSSKPVPPGTYRDYYEKITAYVAILEGFARAIDSSVTARTSPVVREEGSDATFTYLDTATSRAGIGVAAAKLRLGRVAIVGLGGTGSYILDLLAKTPVHEIHLFDGDVFLTHNAFRSPGAASIEMLASKPRKVAYHEGIYSQMHRGIRPHPYNLDAQNVAELEPMNFVFLAIDPGESKGVIVAALETYGIPFIDVGLGVTEVDNALTGVIRVTTSLPNKRDHFRSRVSLGARAEGGEYDRNIQIADLNALNAALAVVRWKRYCGFYHDFERECHATYSIDCNVMTNDEQI
jgi:hypothetical protein